MRIVQGQIKRIKIAKTPCLVKSRELAVNDQRHALLAQAAVGAKRHFKCAQVMARGRRANHGEALRHRHQIANTVGRQLKPLGSLLARQHQFHPFDEREAVSCHNQVSSFRQVDRGERAQGAVVYHVGVSDRQNHTGNRCTQPLVKPVLQVHHIGRAVHGDLGVHAVVCRQHNDTAQRFELVKVAVHHAVKRVGTVGARCVLVLHIVGRRQVHHIRLVGLHDLHASCKYKL